jgi:signal peptidase I
MIAPACRSACGWRGAAGSAKTSGMRGKNRQASWFATLRRDRGLFAVVGAFAGASVLSPWAPARVATDSMAPTVRPGDHILIDKRERVPRRNDLVVFDDPLGDGGLLIKRVVGVEGDPVGIDGGLLTIDGVVVDEEYSASEPLSGVYYGPLTVPKGYVFLLGDNRAESVDSVKFGPIPVDALSGSVRFRLWPAPWRVAGG